MKFLDIIKELQLKNHGYIVIVRNGIFFIGVGKDAILLNKILGLKLICLKTGICKAGFPVRKIEEYIKQLSFANKSFVVYQYDRNSEKKEKEIFRYNGEETNEGRCCLNCKDCNMMFFSFSSMYLSTKCKIKSQLFIISPPFLP